MQAIIESAFQASALPHGRAPARWHARSFRGDSRA